jgi:hypothetical protein
VAAPRGLTRDAQVLTIRATIQPTVALGTIVANQGTVQFDANCNGTNEAFTLTDDPGKPGASDPTSFVVVSPSLDFYYWK